PPATLSPYTTLFRSALLSAVPESPLILLSTFATPLATWPSSSMTSITTFPSATHFTPNSLFLIAIRGSWPSYCLKVFIVLHLVHFISASPLTFPNNLLHSLLLTVFNLLK